MISSTIWLIIIFVVALVFFISLIIWARKQTDANNYFKGTGKEGRLENLNKNK